MDDILRGPRSWLASAVCAAGVAASLLALSGLLQPGRWLGAGVLAVVGLAAVLAVARSATRAWWTPTVVGALAGTIGLLIAYAAPPGRRELIPDRESVARLGDLLRAGLQAADASRPPADATVPLEVLVVAGALLVMLAVDLIAVGLGAPAWSGPALLALWIPPLVIGRPAGTSAFVGTALAYLLLLAVTAAPTRATRRTASAGERRRRVLAALGPSGVVTVVALALGSIGPALPGWSSVRLPDTGTSAGTASGLDQDLDMRQPLGTRSSEVVLTYRADPVPAGPLRLYTLHDYDGDGEWAPPTAVVDDVPSAPRGGVLWPVRDLTPEPPGEGPPGRTRLDVRVEGLREIRLPVPVMPRSVEVGGDLAYESRRDEVIRPRPTTRGMEYSMDVRLLGLTDDVLRATGEDDPRDVADYLAVPETSHTGDVVRAAQAITSGQTTRYDKALALQSYFRSVRDFTYTSDVGPARSDDAVWDFLGSRSGYCVQFATAMTVMARTLDIPARLAVGFLQGEPDDSGRWVVTGREYHAWPELYFPGAGWVRFEPTPATQTGVPPRWADPLAGLGAPFTDDGEPTAVAPTGGPVPTSAPAPQAGTTESADSASEHLVPIGTGLGVLVLALGALLLRGRRARSDELRPEVAWAHLRSRLAGAGILWSDAQTPRQAAALVTAEIETRKGGPMDAEARAALRDLMQAVEDQRYAVDPSVWEHAQLQQRVATVMRDVTRPTHAGSRRA